MTGNRQILLASRPRGRATVENFRVVEVPLAPLTEGRFRLRNHYLSVDPYMRGRMDDVKSYAQSFDLGEVMPGRAIGEVIESRHPKYRQGEWVSGDFGWQLYASSDGREVRRIDVSSAPLTWHLGVLGMPGVTAWIGLLHLARPKAGETVLVSAAAGAVGSVVGQIAKIQGCRAVGIAGGQEKCAYVAGELGFDACIDYKSGRLEQDLKAATANGVDVYFDNVGGEILDAALTRLNMSSRISLCGMISRYNTLESYGVRNLLALLVNRVRLQGFIVSDYLELWPRALAELSGWVKEGRLKYRVTIVEGLANAPRALLDLLDGKNIGKQLVKLV